MYKEFFGLDDLPFTLTPDPRFIVFTPSYNKILASLYYGLENAKGLIVLTGEVGTGKTTALRWILRRMDASVLAAYIFNPRLSIEEFYHQVTQMLNVKDWSNKADLLQEMGKVLKERHRRGLRTVLIIDEAQELSDYVLEEIRLLLNFESDDAKHLQIVLTGQLELRERLNQQNLRQLKQRVALRCFIHSLPSIEEVDHYITERLLIAGSEQPNIFTPSAIDLIFQCSEGIPRQINNICDNAMIAAYAAGEEIINRQMIESVAENLDLLPSKRALQTNEKASKKIASATSLKFETHEEIWSNPPNLVNNEEKLPTNKSALIDLTNPVSAINSEFIYKIEEEARKNARVYSVVSLLSFAVITGGWISYALLQDWNLFEPKTFLLPAILAVIFYAITWWNLKEFNPFQIPEKIHQWERARLFKKFNIEIKDN